MSTFINLFLRPHVQAITPSVPFQALTGSSRRLPPLGLDIEPHRLGVLVPLHDRQVEQFGLEGSKVAPILRAPELSDLRAVTRVRAAAGTTA